MKNDLTPLPKEEIETNLKKISGWKLKDNMIQKDYQFPNFLEALKFINNLSKSFEEISHHPDIHIYYNKINFSLYTHDAGDKITPIDFTVANEIEMTYKGLQ